MRTLFIILILSAITIGVMSIKGNVLVPEDYEDLAAEIELVKPIPEPIIDECPECIPLSSTTEVIAKIGYIIKQGEKDLRYQELKTKGFKKIWITQSDNLYIAK